MPKKDWRVIAKQKQEERESRLPAKWRIKDLPLDDILDVTQLFAERKWLNREELEITALSAVQLAKAIKDRQYTSIAVVEAYAHRATIAQQLVNPLTEINFEEAIKEAQRLDDHLENTGEVVGPMRGIPISIKDQFHVKGLNTTMGYCAWAGRIAEKDSLIVSCLKKAGAIILTKTNLAQTMMALETINLVFGRSLNPYNRTLHPGASSGGEGALLAMRGSAIGIGSDYGGSIRAPATFCGLYGIRPSWGRLSYQDASNAFEGLDTRRSCPGPMGNSPEDLGLLMSSYIAARPWRYDQEVLDMPWKGDVMPAGPLCFAIIYGDEDITPHPPILRGMMHVVAKLRQAGHLVVDWRGPLRTKEFLEVGDQITLSGGKEDILRSIESTKEPIYPETADYLDLYDPSKGHPSPYDIWQIQLKKQRLVDWFHTTWQSTTEYSMTGRPIDGLIMPGNYCVAPPHLLDCDGIYKEPRYGFTDASAICDRTVAAFPTGLRQDPAIDLPVKDFQPKTEDDKRLQAYYDDPEIWRGAPIGLQLIAGRLEEEKMVGMLCEIRDALEKT